MLCNNTIQGLRMTNRYWSLPQLTGLAIQYSELGETDSTDINRKKHTWTLQIWKLLCNSGMTWVFLKVNLKNKMFCSIEDKCMFLQWYIFACETAIPYPVHSENIRDCWRFSKRGPKMWYWYSEQMPHFYSQSSRELEDLQLEKV